MTAPTGLGVRRRLLIAQTLVLLAGGVTTWVVASVVGPPLFREHLHQAGVAHDSNEQFHAEQAYQHATALSIAVAITVAALTAFVVTAYLSRRLQRSIAEVAAAASAVAEGRYDIRVAPPELGEEFDELAAAFNRMAERLQSVESTRRQLFGDLAHEIRTPVSVLEAYLEAVEDGVKTLDPQTIAMLREQTGRLVRFSNDAAALAQAEEAHAAITPQWVDISELIGAVGAAVADRYASKHVALATRAHGGRLWADRQRLTQVLGNLLDNALRHTPAGGHVTLTATLAGPEVMFTVADDGEGIAPEHLPHLFERFYRADYARDRGRGGSGIGLAIVKALTEAHGGHVTVTSRGPGHGTTFTATIPASPQSAAPQSAALSEGQPADVTTSS
ncbi:MAG TPA: HAMP domain-containing sensor histidine kinase [Mycobacterium sp.]|uniref:sensor histidine kinase n=1 Tax=Mycolicibacterium sp. TaxID=2320850 RepID=UPI0025FA0071|nr:HAMP domain-containing sensor histidine kinase [Mycolicibacterium sp.]HPX38698.1 HAMP domain-containing sensor histidine kinase [Mycobacterium sp.]HQC76018.1 HAMP domain-containing sensor histidine kinase [Mycobacterium sp.]